MFQKFVVGLVLLAAVAFCGTADAGGYGSFGVKNGFGYSVSSFNGYGNGFNSFGYGGFGGLGGYGGGFGSAGYGGCNTGFGSGFGGYGSGFGGYGASSAFVYPTGFYPSFSGAGYNNQFFFGKRVVRDRFGRVFVVRGVGGY